MSCSEVSQLTPLWLSSELDPAQARDFTRHLDSCPACREGVAELQACDEQLRNGVRAESLDTTYIDAHVLHAIRAQKAARPWLPAAAALLLAMVGYQALLSAGMKSTLAAAAKDHHTELVDRQPRKWITDPAALQTLARKQGFDSSAVAAPDGYHLAQGRLCFLNGQIFLHLVYMTGAGNFSLFLRRPSKTSLAALHGTAAARDFALEHTAGFQKHYLTAVVVTEQPGDIARHMAATVAASL